MDETLFYVFGIALVSRPWPVGDRPALRGFPPSRASRSAMIAYFAALVAATTTFAVLNARDEQAHEARGQGGSRGGPQPASRAATTTHHRHDHRRAPSAGGDATLSSRADPTPDRLRHDELSGKAGKVTIDFTNPSAVDPRRLPDRLRAARRSACSADDHRGQHLAAEEPEARQVHLLLQRGRPRGRRHEGHPDGQVAADSPHIDASSSTFGDDVLVEGLRSAGRGKNRAGVSRRPPNDALQRLDHPTAGQGRADSGSFRRQSEGTSKTAGRPTSCA